MRLANPFQPMLLNEPDDPLESGLHIDGKSR